MAASWKDCVTINVLASHLQHQQDPIMTSQVPTCPRPRFPSPFPCGTPVIRQPGSDPPRSPFPSASVDSTVESRRDQMRYPLPWDVDTAFIRKPEATTIITAHMTSSIFGVGRGASLVTHRADSAKPLRTGFRLGMAESDVDSVSNYFGGPRAGKLDRLDTDWLLFSLIFGISTGVRL